MEKNKCSERFSSAYQLIELARKQWDESDGTVINGRKAMSEGFVEAIEDAINQTADFAVNGDLHQIDEESCEVAMLFDLLASAYRDFKRRACSATSLTEVDVDGDGALWRALNTLAEWFSARYNYQFPHPIAVYRQQMVGDEQIARIYGWIGADGEVEIEKVAEEEANPGRHYQQESWVHPAKRARINAAKTAFSVRQLRRREYLRDSDFGKSVVPSLDELVKLGAPPEQIAKLHGIDVEDAEALLRSRPADSSKDANDAASAQRLERDTEAASGKSRKIKV